MSADIWHLWTSCTIGSAYGKNLKSSKSINSSEPLPNLSEPNKKLQMDFAEHIFDSKGKTLFFLVAIDSFLNYPPALITSKSAIWRFVKFLNKYINQKVNKKVWGHVKIQALKTLNKQSFCKSEDINQIFLPVGRQYCGCMLSERCTQTLKGKIYAMHFDSKFGKKQPAAKSKFDDFRKTRQAFVNNIPIEHHYGRKLNTKWTYFRNKLISSVYSDQQKLEKSMLKPKKCKNQLTQGPDWSWSKKKTAQKK